MHAKRLTLVYILGLAGVMFLLTTCAPRPPEAIRLIDEYLSRYFPEHAPGGAVLIMKGDIELLIKGYGMADLKTRERVNATTLFNLGSLSKTFTVGYGARYSTSRAVNVPTGMPHS